MAIRDFHMLCNKAHLDIKPDNFVLKEDFSVALIDFGHAKELGIETSEQSGTE